jgi:hypothetical protein
MSREASSNKRGIAIETLIKWLIAIGALVIGILIYLALSNKGSAALAAIKHIFGFSGG